MIDKDSLDLHPSVRTALDEFEYIQLPPGGVEAVQYRVGQTEA